MMPPLIPRFPPSRNADVVRRGTYGTFLSLIATQGRLPNRDGSSTSQSRRQATPGVAPYEVALPSPPPQLHGRAGLLVSRTANGQPPASVLLRKRRLEPHRMLITCPLCSELITYVKRSIVDNTTWISPNFRRMRCGRRVYDWQLEIVSDLRHHCPKCRGHVGTFRYKNI